MDQVTSGTHSIVVPTTETTKKGRIFLLHAWGQNAVIMKYKTKTLIKKLNKVGYDCVCLEAPHVLPLTSKIMVDGVSVEIDNGARENSRAWFFYSSDDPGDATLCQTKTPLHYVGLDESIQLVLQELGRGSSGNLPCFVLGFSQGAVFAHILSRLAETTVLLPSLRATILCSGFAAQHVCNDASLYQLGSFQDGQQVVSMPSLHVIGRKDTFVEPSLSLDLASRFQNSQVLYHEKGHVIPQASIECAAIISFLDKHLSTGKGAT